MWYHKKMTVSKVKKTESIKTQPTQPSGSLKIAGKVVAVSKDTVKRTSGSSSTTILKSLKEASKKVLFPTTAFMAHE